MLITECRYAIVTIASFSSAIVYQKVKKLKRHEKL
jgi:hypothetical protein